MRTSLICWWSIHPQSVPKPVARRRSKQLSQAPWRTPTCATAQPGSHATTGRSHGGSHLHSHRIIGYRLVPAQKSIRWFHGQRIPSGIYRFGQPADHHECAGGLQARCSTWVCLESSGFNGQRLGPTWGSFLHWPMRSGTTWAV